MDAGWYAAQDSPVPVFAGELKRLEVRWPGGRQISAAVPPGAREITVVSEGRVQRLR